MHWRDSNVRRSGCRAMYEPSPGCKEFQMGLALHDEALRRSADGNGTRPVAFAYVSEGFCLTPDVR